MPVFACLLFGTLELPLRLNPPASRGSVPRSTSIMARRTYMVVTRAIRNNILKAVRGVLDYVAVHVNTGGRKKFLSVLTEFMSLFMVLMLPGKHLGTRPHIVVPLMFTV